MRYDITSPQHREALANNGESMAALIQVNRELEAEVDRLHLQKEQMAVKHQRDMMSQEASYREAMAQLLHERTQGHHYKRWALIFLVLAILNAIAAFLMRY